MNPKQQSPVKLSLGQSSQSLEVSPQQARRELRRQVEELKVQVLELAEHQMDITLRVIRSWIETKQ